MSNLNLNIFLLSIAIVFWLLFIPRHRTAIHKNKMYIGRLGGKFFGSINGWVDRTAFAFQIGFASFFIWHVILIRLGVYQIGYLSSLLTLCTIGVVRIIVKIAKLN